MIIYNSNDVAKILKISPRRLIYLEKTGKIDSAKKTSTGQRYYFYEDVCMLRERLKKIEKCRKSKKSIESE